MQTFITSKANELHDTLDNWYFYSSADVKCKIFGLKDYDYYLEWHSWIDCEWDEFTLDKKIRAFNDFDKFN